MEWTVKNFEESRSSKTRSEDKEKERKEGKRQKRKRFSKIKNKKAQPEDSSRSEDQKDHLIFKFCIFD